MSPAPARVDLRSDTLTRPTPAMLAAMTTAPVGDDVYDEDPTVQELERRTAELLGHEAGLYCATGSLSNLLGVRALVEPGQEVLCDSAAHIARAEMGAHAAVFGVTMRTWPSEGGVTTLEQVDELLSPDAGPYLVSTGAVALENTHNFAGGTVQPLAHLREVTERAAGYGIGRHLDGARLWNAHVASGVAMSEYGRLFDTVSVCYSKGMGAPVGSVLVGSAETVARARVWRKRLGGGWRQAGVLAAACLHALDHHLPDLATDHENARLLAEVVAGRAPDAVDPAAVQTNIVALRTGATTAREVVAAAAEQGVVVGAVGPRTVRAVTHRDVSTEECRRAGEVLGRVLSSAARAA
ncbi:low specificity L-threonine aldolase [Auraticoccus sp. F435]|uniref:Low specificity L-threonine aldolase n=1 Tax=Auraticoccus cholistanensis TaxID=2656650 RepID=A0A6A9UWV7_9ACTN|nr:threonine aldolase family protein [Auraticoccus cholistanensis]MVA77333.1 low specificity L-threonine aldolase [Auraticoccus cholistanensis]